MVSSSFVCCKVSHIFTYFCIKFIYSCFCVLHYRALHEGKMSTNQVISEEEELPLTLTATGGSTAGSNADISARMPWGRLIAGQKFLKSVDLVESFCFGRGDTCSITIKPADASKKFLSCLSKIHFEIEKSSEDNLIYITDHSKNGTFINQQKIGKGHRKILKNQDEIAISGPSHTLYIFLTHGTEGTESFLPPELVKRFASVRELGRGSCGEVRLVKDRDTFKSYAIKKIVLSESNSSLLHKINHPTKVYNEINILRTLSHPCVISMKDIIHIEREVYLVLEYMAGGELNQRVLNQPMTEDVAKFYFIQMVYATEYLHSQNIIHRDLKPENILLLDDQEETLLKLADFGLSKITDDSDAKTKCGTLRYVAPEVINNKTSEYGKGIDVWSLGVILYFMISRELPFEGEEIAKNILKGRYDFSKKAWRDDNMGFVKDLIRKMLQLSPEQRITVGEILKHKWITQENSVHYRIKRLLDSIETPMQELSLDPTPKKLKITNCSDSSDESNHTLTNVDRSYSSSSTVCG